MKEGGYAALMFYEPNDKMMTFTAVRSNQLLALLKVNIIINKTIFYSYFCNVVF